MAARIAPCVPASWAVEALQSRLRPMSTYERVADLTDPGDISRRADGGIEVALTPTVENQVFYFFSLRRRDY